MGEEESSGDSSENEEVEEVIQATKKQRRPPHEVWAHVTKCTNAQGKPAWICKYCHDERTGAPERVEHHLVKCGKVGNTQSRDNTPIPSVC